MSEEEIKQNNKDNIEFALKIMGRKLDAQNQAFNSLESKIGILLGFVGVIAGSAITLLQSRHLLFCFNLFTLGLLGIFATLTALVIASQTREFLDPPDFPDFYSDEILLKPNLELKNFTVANMKAAYEHNGRHHETKAQLYDFAIYCFLVSIILLFLAVIIK